MIQTFLSIFGILLGLSIFIWAAMGVNQDPIRAVCGMVVSFFVAVGFLGNSIVSATSWNTHNWLHDVKTGTTWEIGEISPEATMQIYKTVADNVRWTVADFPRDPHCSTEWTPGKDVMPKLGDGYPYRIEVIGRATQPDFRYLVKANGGSEAGLDPDCTVKFLVTAEALVDIKAGWKKEIRIINNPLDFKSVARETASVRPIH